MPRLFLTVFLGLAFLLGGPGISHAGTRHKLQTSDSNLGRQIISEGGRLLADYGSYQLYETTNVPPARAQIRDEYNHILLNAAQLDTSTAGMQTARKAVGNFQGRRMHLVHFVGPVQPAWRNALLAAGVQIAAYIPQNAYLVYGDAASLAHVQNIAAASYVQWDGAYADEYKIHPAARGNAAGEFAIQLVADAAANAATLQLLDQLKLGPVKQKHRVLRYLNVIVPLAAADLPRVASRPDVISIQPHLPHAQFCERQDQIISGNLSGNVPSGPGYLAWLEAMGFTQEQFTASGFVIDVADSGIDNGTTSPHHFGFYAGGNLTNASRVVYNQLIGTPNVNSTLEGCDGHGNINAHIAGGYDDGAGFPFADDSGFHFGLGACPFASLGSSVVFDPLWTNPSFNDLESSAYQKGARINNDSWGEIGNPGAYDVEAQEFDSLVRDAQPAGTIFSTPGNQEMIIVVAAGNNGPNSATITVPATAKNVIAVGASENVQAIGGTDKGGISDAEAESANDIPSFSARGPCSDGRMKPDIMAPGTHVSGGVIQAANPGPDGTADSCYSGSGVSGGPDGSLFFPTNQQFYTCSSGTSHSSPCVAGGAALLRQYFINHSFSPPSAAMTKACLINSARYLSGNGANDTLWSPNQGMGEMDLAAAFDGEPRILRDELGGDLFTASGQLRTFIGAIADTNQPFRVTVAWTDAPGTTAGAAYNNNLDLTVSAGGNTYLGNVFSGAFSTAGGSADIKNNVESVFLPPGVAGSFTVTVTATSINSIGVPNIGDAPNQDFAIVIYNAVGTGSPALVAAGASVVAENCSPTNGAIDPDETVTVNFAVQNTGGADASNVVISLVSSGGVTNPSACQTIPVISAGAAPINIPFTFTAEGNCGGTLTATLEFAQGETNFPAATYDFPLGQFVSSTNFAENFDEADSPPLPSGWITSASGAQSPWSIVSDFTDTPPNSVFAMANDDIGIAELDSPVIPIQTDSAQLTFANYYFLEADPSTIVEGYDGGVLEIEIGTNTWSDILTAGGSFVTNGYNRTISNAEGPGNNPLAGRQAWSGNSGGFITTIVNLPPAAAGQNIQLRWLCGTDEGNYYGSTGWWIDTISIIEGGHYECCKDLVPPVILNPHLDGTNFVFSFQTVGTQTYAVESKSALTNSTWIPSLTIPGDGYIHCITNCVPATASANSFYHIRSY